MGPQVVSKTTLNLTDKVTEAEHTETLCQNQDLNPRLLPPILGSLNCKENWLGIDLVGSFQLHFIQWFSTQGKFCPPGDMWQYLERIFTVMTGEEMPLAFSGERPVLLLNIPLLYHWSNWNTDNCLHMAPALDMCSSVSFTSVFPALYNPWHGVWTWETFVDHINKVSAWKFSLEPRVDHNMWESNIIWMQNWWKIHTSQYSLGETL